MSREIREVQVWIRGEWKLTKGIFRDDEICQYPLCNRKIPSKRAKLPHYRRGWRSDKYCSRECEYKHKNNEHLKRKLNNFL